ncbi:methyl-accepting chemotaxis protein [Oceanospirillum sediminis]|uniref:Methyl-accepting chemotaxis protein n=1 Tax=Oceanospirillum sediminis TaxID=2760088 RepID=A0A839IQX2_9GAMM|nr:methyl-accepting chemotaxis protein [Oceanospirillum sediminis]MBB1487665.1 methyl-accepting chemotaxis protein [Oceanospirillum sediminis]
MNFNLRSMAIRWRLASMLLVTLAGMAILAVVALNEIRFSMQEEKSLKTQHLVEAAHQMLDFWHRKVETGELSPSEARNHALDSLKAMRYGDNDYFWVQDMQGNIVMHPTRQNLEGRSVLHIKDPDGIYMFKEMTELAGTHGKGVIHYSWPKPGQDKAIKKVAYIEYEPQWGWIIGSGIYLDDIDKQFWSSARLFIIIAGIVAAIIAVMVITISGSIIRPINRTVEAMDEISQGEGDLTRHIEAEGDDEICRMVRHFNRFVDKIHDLVYEARQSTNQVATAAEELDTITTNSSKLIQKQTDETDQMATAIDEMTQTIEDVARNAADAAEAARKADLQAAHGSDKVAAAIDSLSHLVSKVQSSANVIHQLEERSEAIGSVLGVIRDVAEQTNLLALNAAIEAARAGEQGRGFAVVADEVRQLAGRTQQSTEEIHSIISALQQTAGTAVTEMRSSLNQADQTVDVANQANEALQIIRDAVTQINTMNMQIASAAEEQTAAASEISKNVSNMVELANQGNAWTQDTATASHEMAQLAEGLRGIVGSFKV